jgi:hypothetical protein
VLGKSQRYGLGRRLEVGQNHGTGLAPINVIRRVILFPERPLFPLTGKFRYGLNLLFHKPLSLVYAYLWLK